MSRNDTCVDSYRWTPVEDWAAARGLGIAVAKRHIEAEALSLGRIGGRWHVCASPVEVTYPDPTDPMTVRLRIAANRYRQYLTTGPDVLSFELRYDSDQCGRAGLALATAQET
jgi:hypothetical protein